MFASVSSRSGRLLKGDRGARTFEPTALPPRDLCLSPRQWRLVTEAEQAIGELRGALRYSGGIRGICALAAAQEGVAAAQLDGQKLALEELLRWQIDTHSTGAHATSGALRLAANYADMLRTGLGSTPEHLDLQRLHRRLYQGLEGRAPAGSLRRELIWLGPRGSRVTEAPYVPAAPAGLPRHMDALQRFVTEAPGWPPLVHAALVSYQIDTLHPFLDGSGRLARLSLVHLLSSPEDGVSATVLRPARQWARDPAGHFQQLQQLRAGGDFESWIGSFARSMLGGARAALSMLQEIRNWLARDLARVHQQMPTQGKPAARLLHGLVAQPIIDIRSVARCCQRNYANANILVSRLVHLGVLKEMTGQRRNRRYVSPGLMRIIEKSD